MANDACCGRGGGSTATASSLAPTPRATDTPGDWKSPSGCTCGEYVSKSYCAADGGWLRLGCRHRYHLPCCSVPIAGIWIMDLSAFSSRTAASMFGQPEWQPMLLVGAVAVACQHRHRHQLLRGNLLISGVWKSMSGRTCADYVSSHTFRRRRLW